MAAKKRHPLVSILAFVVMVCACAGVCNVVFDRGRDTPAPPSSEATSEPPRRDGQDADTIPAVALNARVVFDGIAFTITNNDRFAWREVELSINPGLFTAGYTLRARRIDAGGTYVVGAVRFTKSDGLRFNPFSHEPRKFRVRCKTPGGGDGIYLCEWE